MQTTKLKFIFLIFIFFICQFIFINICPDQQCLKINLALNWNEKRERWLVSPWEVSGQINYDNY